MPIAHSFKIIDPELKHRATEQWEQAFQIFNQLLPGSETACQSLSPLGGGSSAGGGSSSGGSDGGNGGGNGNN